MKPRTENSSTWINGVLLDIIKRELEKGRTEEEIKKMLISYGFKPLEFKNEFKFLAPQINQSLPSRNIPQKTPLIIPKEKKKNKIIAPILALTTVAICCIFVFQYSKELKNIGNQALGFTKSHTYDKIFKKNAPPITSPNNIDTLTIITVATSSTETSTDSSATMATSNISTIVAGTSTVATSTDNIEFAFSIKQSKILWNKGKYDKSLTMAQTALEKAGNDEEKAKAQYWIGLSYYSQGKKTESETAELLAIGLNPDYEPPYVTLSAIKLDQKDYNQAFAYAQKALRLEPNDYWNLNNLGLAYMHLGDKENAITHLQKAVSLAPNLSVLQSNLLIAIQKIY